MCARTVLSRSELEVVGLQTHRATELSSVGRGGFMASHKNLEVTFYPKYTKFVNNWMCFIVTLPP